MKHFLLTTLFVLVGVGLPSSASAQILPPNTYQASMHSAPGDPWSYFFGKSDWLYTGANAQFLALAGGYPPDNITRLTITVRAFQGDLWQFTFDVGGSGQPMKIGRYDDATTEPGNLAYLDVHGLGGGCITRNGKFAILDLDYHYQPNYGFVVTRFAASFEQHCYYETPALTGTVYFNSNGFQPPPKLLMKDRPPLPDATVGDQYSQLVQAEGGLPPYACTIDTGQLPPGISLNPNGTISGAATASGTYVFKVQIVDSSYDQTGYPPQVVSRDFSITVNAAVLSIPESLPPTAGKDAGYTYQFAAHGGLPPYQWGLVDGKLPPGLGLSKEGKLTGTPDTPGAFTFTLRATDSASAQADRKYVIKVIDPPHIDTAKFKVNKGKLMISGERFDVLASLFIDGLAVKPKSQDSESMVVKALSLALGPHEIRVVNPDGGTASVTIMVE